LDIPNGKGGGRGRIDGVYPDNRARSGIVVFETDSGRFCLTPEWCRYLCRHEIGHALGFLDHSTEGLMRSTPDTLTERERAMTVALYSLPHDAQLQPDGRWVVPATAEAGVRADVQAAQDIIDWNMNADAGSSYRSPGTITRWELPFPVLIVQSCPGATCAF
jgi:hypothetical protein